MKQAQESLKLEQDVAQKIAARAFAKAYLQDLVPSVFNNLRDNGYFYDPVEHEIETSFMPWLMDKTMKQVNHLVLGRTILDSIIRDVVNQRIDDYEKLAETLRQVNISFFWKLFYLLLFYIKRRLKVVLKWEHQLGILHMELNDQNQAREN
jgi:hypothetical protein